MQQFVSLPVIKSVNDVKGLRKLYEKVESSVRNLKTLDVDPSSYGNLLVPLINAKLPNELKFLITRKFENEVWPLSDLLKTEIEANRQVIILHNLDQSILTGYLTLTVQRTFFALGSFLEIPQGHVTICVIIYGR